MRILLTSIASIFLGFSPALSATVSCAFMSETSISQSGEWLKTEMDFMKLYEMFGDDLKLPLENSLLANLDTGEVFVAGEVSKGTVYLMGGDLGITGKLINVEGVTITIFDSMCNVGFG